MTDKITQLKELIFKNSKHSTTSESFQYLPLKEEQIIEFEERHKLSFPEDFKDFLVQVGNGGPGPGSGILPVEIYKTYAPLGLPWINPKEFNDLFQYNGKENFDAFSNRMNHIFKNEDSDASKMYRAADNGLLCIADAGGGTYYNLVLNGPYKGQIWINAMVSDGGFVWRANSFKKWYQNWLDKKIEKEEERLRTFENLSSFNDTNTFIPQNSQELHDIIGRFKNIKDKKFVKILFEKLLSDEEKHRPEILQACITYLLYDAEFLDYELALKFISKAAHNSGERLEKTLLCQHGTALAGLSQTQQAIIFFEKALEFQDDEYEEGELDDESMKLLSLCHLKLGRSEKAFSIMESEGEIYDMDTVVSLLNDCYRVHKDYQLTAKWGQLILDWELFQEDEESEDYLSDIYLNMIYSHARLKNTEQVKVFLGKLVQTKPNEEMVPYEVIAEELIQAKSYSIALQCLETYASFSRAKENRQGLHNLKGCCYAGLGSYEEAIIHFQKSFNVHQGIVPYSNMMRCNIQLEKYQQAQQIFNLIVDFDPNNPWTYYQFALYHIQMKDEHKAAALLQKAISLGFDKNEILADPDYKVIAKSLGEFGE